MTKLSYVPTAIGVVLIDRELFEHTLIFSVSTATYTLIDTPLTLKNLLNALVDIYEWYTLGIELNIPHYVLKAIEEKYLRDTQRCKSEMLATWLQREPHASWQKILEALWKMQHNTVALRIQTTHGKGRRNSQVGYHCHTCTCLVTTVDSPLSQIQFSGPCVGKRFQKLEKTFMSFTLSCNDEGVEELERKIAVKQRISTDVKVVALWYKGISKGLFLRQYHQAHLIFDEALHAANSLDCQNGLLLQGRIWRFYASLCTIERDYDKAMECIERGKVLLLNAAPTRDTASLLFEEVTLKILQGNSGAQHKEIQEGYDKILSHALVDHELPLRCLFLTHKAFFHLNSYHLSKCDDRISYISAPSKEDMSEAKTSIEGAHRTLEELGEAALYRAQYYLACLDFHLWKGEYSEAREYGEKANALLVRIHHTSPCPRVPDPQQRLMLLERLVHKQEIIEEILNGNSTD